MIGALATVFVLLATAVTPAADSTVSLVKAQVMAGKIAALEKQATLAKPARKAPMSVSDAEVNSYVNLTRGSEMPKGLSDVMVRFQRDRLAVRGLLDLDSLRGRAALPEGLDGLLSFVSGKVPVEVTGRLRIVSEGVGAFAIEDAHLASLPVSATVIERLTLWATKSPRYPEGLDIHAPFRLPYALKRVRIEPGRALLD
jgi:hypothetical protein